MKHAFAHSSSTYSGSVSMDSMGSWEPIIFEQWVPEPINFEKKQLKCISFSVENDQEIGLRNFD